METQEGPARFECPADFCPCPFSPAPSFSQETLRSPSTQLWLIRAPANFRPESLDGHAVPLLGSRMLKALQPDGTRKVYSFQAVPGDLDSAHLLMPSSHQDRLVCAPPFSGLLSVCERFGDPDANRSLFPVEARLAPQIPAGLKQRFLPFGGHQQGSAIREVAEEPPRKKKKKKRELHTLEYMGAPEEPLSPQHKPCPIAQVPAEVLVAPAEAGSLQEERRHRKRRHREVPLAPAVGTAPQLLPEQSSSSLEGSSQKSLSGGVTDTSHGSRKKRKKEKQQKEEAEGWLPEPSSLPQQPSLEKIEAAEGLLPSKMKKKKRQLEEEAAVALVDVASAEQEAEGGQGDFQGPEPILESSLGESLPTGRHKKKKKKKVVVEEPEAGAPLLVPSPVQIDLVDWAEQVPEQEVPGLPGEEGASQKHKKKKKKHKKEAAEEESRPA